MAGGILPPLSVIGNWPTPNYTNPVDRGWGLVIAVIVLSTASTFVVCARLWARIKAHNMGIDDWIMILAMIPALGMSVLICLASRLYGFNHHIWDNTLETSIKGRKVVMAIEATYLLSTGLIKISILLFYRRLVAGTFSRFFVWSVRIIISSVIAYMVTFELTLLLGCRPIHAYWDEVNPIWRGLNTYNCLDEVATLFSANITSIVQDFLTFLMPLLLFRKLQLPRRQKMILACIFGIGFFLCIIGVVRLVYTKIIYFETYDVTWESQPLWYWTAGELHGALICASAPALKIYFKHYLHGSSARSGPAYKPQAYNKGDHAPRDVEKGAIDKSFGTDTTFSYGGQSTVSTFVGADSADDPDTMSWMGKVDNNRAGMAGWNNLNEHFGGVNVGRTVESFTTPSAIAIPLRKHGSGTLVNVPPRHLTPMKEEESWFKV